MSRRRQRRVKQAVKRPQSVLCLDDSVSQPMDHFADHIPAALRIERRHTRDDREEELAQLRTADGRVLALVERVDPASLPN
jgi:hypothetical protein